MSSTKIFAVPNVERRNYIDCVLALWSGLQWRHAGFGALQAYIREGDARELRVHIWHPSLVREGIAESGLCHDHRFHMRSTVLAGRIEQTDFELTPAPDGEYETWRVLHARAAQEQGGSFHADPLPTGERFNRTPHTHIVRAGQGYSFEKFAFHETRSAAPSVTLVEKSAQEDVNARILAPAGKPIVHAFSEPLPKAMWWAPLTDAKNALYGALRDIDYDEAR
jgi:hypothetical protein